MENVISTVNKIAKEWEEFQTKAAQLTKTPNTLTKLENEMKNYADKLSQIETYLNRPSNIIEEKNYGVENFIRFGEQSHLESKSLNSAKDDEGGFLVTPTLHNKIINLVTQQTPMRKLASVETISSNALDLLIEDNNFSYGWVAETAERPVTDTAKLARKRILVHELYAQPKASQRLIDDAEINIEQWLIERLSEIFAAAENTAFINGDGNAKPKGILKYDANIVEQIAATESSKLSVEDLIKLMHSLPENFSKNATFLMNRKTLTEIQKLQDKVGRFIWQPAISEAIPETLFGMPVITCAEMPDIAENSLSIALADFKAAYKIVDRSGMSLVRDPYTEKPFVKFYAARRVGGEVLNNNAIKLLKF
ncbi:MAG: Phage prohead protease and phage major capsid protein [Rickettsiaceae bacterium]|jgi:HK97 family phage major capsid protein|nr:Phage prohead protease and phage major capsid protein [Rickettsiaceae bacterium]